jgi:trans-aconitate methyltransferase
MPDQNQESLLLLRARDALRHAEKLVAYLENEGYSSPDFSASSPSHPNDRSYDTLCTAFTQAAEDTILLAKGPMQWLRHFFCAHHDLGAWQIALRFGFFTTVPLEQPMSVSELSAITKMDEDRLGRVMKLLATQRCFHEIREGVFEHTALSAFVAQNHDIRALIAFQADEMFEAASYMANSVEAAPYVSDIGHSAFALRFGMSPYQYYAANPERGSRFAAAMAGYVEMNRDLVELRDRFPWTRLEKENTTCTVVDVGGGSGHISVFLATQFPKLNFIVQDINPIMLSQGPKLPKFDQVQERVAFMQYDFFATQPIQHAELFLLRQILHNYNDDKCIRILRSFLPALEKSALGTAILINDMILPTANTKPKVEEHALRQLDMAMLGGYAAKQRTLEEFNRLLESADSRFKITQVHGEGIMGLLEVHLAR